MLVFILSRDISKTLGRRNEVDDESSPNYPEKRSSKPVIVRACRYIHNTRRKPSFYERKINDLPHKVHGSKL